MLDKAELGDDRTQPRQETKETKRLNNRRKTAPQAHALMKASRGKQTIPLFTLQGHRH